MLGAHPPPGLSHNTTDRKALCYLWFLIDIFSGKERYLSIAASVERNVNKIQHFKNYGPSITTNRRELSVSHLNFSKSLARI